VFRRAVHVTAFAALLAVVAAADEPRVAPPPSSSGPPSGERFDQVTVDPTKTSIYVGSVSLTMPPFLRHGGVYTSEYKATVFPLFFYNERGRIAIEFPDESLQRLERGEVVYFKGHAINADGEERRVEGRAVPEGPATDRGKIKVRVWVGKIELIFNTLYRFTGPV
jgi:hypothetical protein